MVKHGCQLSWSAALLEIDAVESGGPPNQHYCQQVPCELANVNLGKKKKKTKDLVGKNKHLSQLWYCQGRKLWHCQGTKSSSTGWVKTSIEPNCDVARVESFHMPNITGWVKITRGPGAPVRSPEWHSHCRHADVPNNICKDSAIRHPRFWRIRFLNVFSHTNA